VSLSADEVRHVAMLARLAVTDEEVEALAPELNAILGYAEQVGEVAAEDIEPTVHPIPVRPTCCVRTSRVRSSTATCCWPGAPRSEDDRIVVPRIVAED
jgi:aspartyl-tRNA(Asn)/glutamyl-tRNA(Gln) amidotransferase subunit C